MYGLLLELYVLTQAACFYVLLEIIMVDSIFELIESHISS